jgi:hypothetical protein
VIFLFSSVGYNLFLSLQKPQFQALADAITAAKTKTVERKDNPSVEPVRRTPRTSTSEEEKIIEETEQVEDDVDKEDEESKECIVS